VLVATLRALKMHGGAPVAVAGEPNLKALEGGLAHLDKHLETVRAFGLTPVVALNVFGNDVAEELALVESHCKAAGVIAARSNGFANGGEGTLDLARAVADVLESTDATPPAPKYLYPLDASYPEKLRAIARTVYGADDVVIQPAAQKELDRFTKAGYAALPVCVAKTHLSLTDDAKRLGRPRGFVVTVREARLSAGAGFVVALLGDILTMPGLPKEPAALRIRLNPEGKIRGLMQNE
jgi:formate--tetrahydrofolate ligase